MIGLDLSLVVPELVSAEKVAAEEIRGLKSGRGISVVGDRIPLMPLPLGGMGALAGIPVGLCKDPVRCRDDAAAGSCADRRLPIRHGRNVPPLPLPLLTLLDPDVELQVLSDRWVGLTPKPRPRWGLPPRFQ